MIDTRRSDKHSAMTDTRVSDKVPSAHQRRLSWLRRLADQMEEGEPRKGVTQEIERLKTSHTTDQDKTRREVEERWEQWQAGGRANQDTPSTTTNEPHDSGGALSSSTRGVETSAKRPSDPPKPAAEAESAVYGSPSGGEKAQPKGHLQEEVIEPKAARDALESMLDEAYDDDTYLPAGRWIAAHVYWCQTRIKGDQYDEGVPVGHRLIKQACREVGCKVPSKTEAVWRPLADAGVLDVERYIYRKDSPGLSRRFLLTARAVQAITEGVEAGYQYKTRYNLVTSRRTRSAYTTEMTYDGKSSWQARSRYVYRALEAYRGQRDLVDRAAVEEHLEALRERRDEARDRYHAAVENAGELTDDLHNRLAGLAREHQRAKQRYQQDLRIWSDIIAQGLEPAEDMPEGIYQYQPAYTVQEASGRVTMTCGLQNASSAMKDAAATDIPGITNYDIMSSQAEGLIQELRMASQMGAPVDAEAVADMPTKSELAARHGVDRDEFKRPNYACFFGAGFAHATYAEALQSAKGRVLAAMRDEDGTRQWSRLDREPWETGEMSWERAVYNALPTMAATARDWADDPNIEMDDPEAIYQVLKDEYGDLADELDAWREWLVDEHWSRRGRHGSRCGYYVSNPCGLAFSIHEERLRDAQTGRISRYDQKAAYATSRLQGLEAAYIHALTILADEYEYEVLRNEHDGLVVLGTIPEEAREGARRISGFHRARLEAKPYAHQKTSQPEPCPTTPSTTPSKPTHVEKPSVSPMSCSDEASDAGCAGGTMDRSGRRTDPMPSGSVRRSPSNSRSSSETTETQTDASGCTTDHQQTRRLGSGQRREKTTGDTSQRSDDTPPSWQAAREMGLSWHEYLLAVRDY